jgi:hypothetical protein
MPSPDSIRLFATASSSYVGLATGEGTCCGSRAWIEMVRFLQFAWLEGLARLKGLKIKGEGASISR